VIAAGFLAMKFVLATAIACALIAVLAAGAAAGGRPRHAAAGPAGPHVSVPRSKAGARSQSVVAHPDTVFRAPWPAYSIVTPHYIYLPGFTGVPVPSSVAEECPDPGENCSDEQLCEYWGTTCSGTSAQQG